MVKSTILLKKFHLHKKEFITSEEIRKECNFKNLNYENVIKYFISKGYLIRIFRGIFYVKNLEEIKYGIKKYNHYELVSKGLELKGVNNWYFGLYTALKFNLATHESFVITYVINDKLYRNKPILIYGRKYKFIKLKPSLLTFGIVESQSYRYSDLEKTILDFIYKFRHNNRSKQWIVMNLYDYLHNNTFSLEKINEYKHHYPNSVKEIINELLIVE